MENVKTVNVFLAIFALFFSGMALLPAEAKTTGKKKGGRKMAIEIKSSAFKNNEMIPSVYTCDGKDISPPLAWSEPPAGTKSFALINDDPDAPVGTWDHWLIYNIPAAERGLSENMPRDAQLKNGAKQGKNGWGRAGYGGPCPPSGVHRYFFKLYALDTELSLPAGAAKQQLESAMKGHILAQTQLIGKYTRKK